MGLECIPHYQFAVNIHRFQKLGKRKLQEEANKLDSVCKVKSKLSHLSQPCFQTLY